jgi:hypothetical protein
MDATLLMFDQNSEGDRDAAFRALPQKRQRHFPRIEYVQNFTDGGDP